MSLPRGEAGLGAAGYGRRAEGRPQAPYSPPLSFSGVASPIISRERFL